jgi:Kef-type K+ transport system membrane component KefB
LGLSVLLILMLGCGLITLKIGIFAEFGAFMLGACLSGNARLHHALGDSFRNFVGAFFLPIFFTYTGLHTDVGSLGSAEQWIIALLLIAVAIVGKFVGCGLTARWNGFSWREAGCIGAMMNTRALMALIVINVGLEQGILDKTLFTMLVMMALVTTLMTTPLLRLFYRGTELEQPIEKSGFYR